MECELFTVDEKIIDKYYIADASLLFYGMKIL